MINQKVTTPTYVKIQEEIYYVAGIEEGGNVTLQAVYGAASKNLSVDSPIWNEVVLAEEGGETVLVTGDAATADNAEFVAEISGWMESAGLKNGVPAYRICGDGYQSKRLYVIEDERRAFCEGAWVSKGDSLVR